jgi:hypothetical protein
MTSYRLTLRDPCGATFQDIVSLEQLKRENPTDALDIENALAAGRNFRVRDLRGSLTVLAR